ncbi:MAG: hypothetical protein ACLUNZ_13955 [Evtepia sp.]
MRWALARGLTAQGFVFDAAIAAYLLAPTDGSYALDKVAGQYFTETFPRTRTIWAAKPGRTQRAQPRPWGPWPATPFSSRHCRRAAGQAGGAGP